MYCELFEFGRCCFCLPLRRGVITFGYVNLILSISIIVLYCEKIAEGNTYALVYYGAYITRVTVEFCITVYVTEILANVILLYGAHMRNVLFVKIYYYYALISVVVTIVIQTIELVNWGGWWSVEEGALLFVGISLQIYIILMVRSLLKRLVVDGPHAWTNQLRQIVEGEVKVEMNELHNSKLYPINEIDSD